MERAQHGFQPLTTIVETQPSQDDADSTSTAACMWSPPKGYHYSTSTQRQADRDRDAQDETVDLLSESDWETYWRSHTDNLY